MRTYEEKEKEIIILKNKLIHPNCALSEKTLINLKLNELEKEEVSYGIILDFLGFPPILFALSLLLIFGILYLINIVK